MNSNPKKPADQAYAIDRKRWCYRGDTITTVKPMSEYAGPNAGLHLNVICDAPESCAYANDLIAEGTWRVSRCGRCKQAVESCECE